MVIKATLWLIMFVWFLMVGTPAFDGAQATSGIAGLQARGELVVAMFHGERPPFFFTDDQGTLVGADVSIAEGIADALGVRLVLDRSAQTFDEVIERVVEGHADLGISKLSVTLDRAQRVYFSTPYVTLNQALLVNRVYLASRQSRYPQLSPIELLQQQPHTVGVMAGTAYVALAHEALAAAEVVEFSDRTQLFQAVSSGTVAAIMWDEHEIGMALQTIPALGLYTTLVPLEGRIDELAIAVAPQNNHLTHWIDVYLRQTRTPHSVRELLAKEKERSR